MREIDVCHLGTPLAICCHEVDGCLVDPGPAASVATLLDALGGERPRAVLLTHIHLDHAGAAGVLVRRWPELPVYVHERGAPHLRDPTRLVRSARMLWPDDFDWRWGEIVPIPEGNLRVLSGGETAEGLRVAYTPGHASHHVAYLHDDGDAYVGDVAGIRIGDGPILPPTPPPDIDLEAWHASVDLVAGWGAERLHLTHFGTFTDVAVHLAVMHEALHAWGELARHVDAAAHTEAIRRRIAGSVGAAAIKQGSPETYWPGLDRYWSTRDAA